MPPKGNVATGGEQEYYYQHVEADSHTSTVCLCNAAVLVPGKPEPWLSIYHSPVLRHSRTMAGLELL
jgi:hypothetical protein